MKIEFFYLINILLLTRLFFFFKDKKLTLKKLIYLNILQIIPLFILIIEAELILLIFIFILINISLYFIEKKRSDYNLLRFLSFCILFFTAGIFTSSIIEVNFNFRLLSILKNIKYYSSFFSSIDLIDWLKINIVLSGFLFILNEVNFFIRYFFELFSLEPKLMPDEKIAAVDEKEYNAGRVIGMVERVLIFFFVLIDQFAAIGFIIAAKGFTRFKELDKREFAEYVLIGTLLSSLFAIVVGLIVSNIY